jgi:hypothetical protein
MPHPRVGLEPVHVAGEKISPPLAKTRTWTSTFANFPEYNRGADPRRARLEVLAHTPIEDVVGMILKEYDDELLGS